MTLPHDEYDVIDRMVGVASKHGLLVQVVAAYGNGRAAGDTVEEAAFGALYDWNIA